MASRTHQIVWVVLTTSDRPNELAAAVVSLGGAPAAIVANTPDPDASDAVRRLMPDECDLVLPGRNLGVPGGRDLGVRETTAPIVGFLDDDAVASPGISDRIVDEFDADPKLGAVALRLVDEDGNTARRHVPRIGGRDPGASGEVVLVLGGACAIRRAAYDEAGGYWSDLFYGHEELELCWRLVDRGWRIRYLADATVFHPRTDIGRHVDGWRLTGRNRVMIARRTLPWPIAITHVGCWLIAGALRAPDRAAKRAYLDGWLDGWQQHVDRTPIRWSTVWRLTRLGRPPVV